MAKLTQKKLISQLQELKQIQPRHEWVVLAKSQIFASPAEALAKEGRKAQAVSIFDIIRSFGFQRKLAYSFATLAFMAVGLIGFAQYTMPGDLLFPVRKLAEQSEAALIGQTVVKQNVVTFNNRINDLAKAAKEGKKDNIPSAISEINTNASELAKSLKENPVDDPNTLKEIAVSLKVLADVPGADLTANPEVKDLYQTVVERQIADLEKTTLTDSQQEMLIEVKDLYSQEKYIDALEEILTINN
jgi:hypothetical protein